MLALVGTVLSLCIGAIGTVLWYLLRQKDSAQAEQIKDLFAFCNSLRQEHNDFRVQVSDGHYKKPELDAKFNHLDDTFKQGLRDITARLESMNNIMVEHFRTNNRS